MEIERKFLLNEIPNNLEQYLFHEIEQAYLCINPVIRIRKEDDEYYLTYKGSGLLAREEYNLPLTQDGYLHLLTKMDGVLIRKRRYCIPILDPLFYDEKGIPSHDPLAPKLTLELDFFDEPFSPLILGEVEFPSLELANTFVPPAYFKEEVTHNPLYHNSNMSFRFST